MSIVKTWIANDYAPDEWAHNEMIEEAIRPSDHGDMLRAARSILNTIDAMEDEYWTTLGFSLKEGEPQYWLERAYIAHAVRYLKDYIGED